MTGVQTCALPICRGIMHDFYVRPGRHNNEYWGNSIDYQIVFFRNFFFRDK